MNILCRYLGHAYKARHNEETKGVGELTHIVSTYAGEVCALR